MCELVPVNMTLYPELQVLVKPRKAGNHPNITEKLFTGM